MQGVGLPLRGASQRFLAAGALAMIALSACSKESTVPSDTPNPSGSDISGQLRQSAFVFDVDVKNGKVKVSAPKASLSSIGGPDGRSYSLLGEDVVDIQATDFFASQVGAIQPNRIRVYFNVRITNRLPDVRLITPTFPTPPAGQDGVLLFPFSFNVTTTSGGTSGSGNEVIVELPSNGEVNASVDWNGNGAPDAPVFPALPGAGGDPFNFFNDQACTAPTNPQILSDCFRFETYGTVEGGAQSIIRRIGFDIDASVGQFRARLIASADLQPVGAGATGAITGTVSSPQRGALAGVSVGVTGVAAPATTGAAGDYAFATVPTGIRSVSLSALPSGCTAPTPQSVTVTTGSTQAVNFSVTCTAQTGSVNLSVTRTGTGTQSLAGVGFTVQPAAAGLGAVTGSLAGAGTAYTGSATAPIGVGAGAGNGAVTLGTLPSGCTAPAPGSYTGLTSGGSQAVTFTVNCLSLIHI